MSSQITLVLFTLLSLRALYEGTRTLCSDVEHFTVYPNCIIKWAPHPRPSFDKLPASGAKDVQKNTPMTYGRAGSLAFTY